MRSSVRILTGSALTAGLVGLGIGTAGADEAYEVQPGDTLATIAEGLDGVPSWQALHETNHQQIDDPAVILPGQELTIPDGEEATYEVRPGDTLAGIVEAHDQVSSWQGVANANSDVISDPNVVIPGQVLRLVEEAGPAPQAEEPTTEPEPATEPDPEPEPAQTPADTGVWDRLAECESNGDWSANTGNGYYGGLQFTLASWEAVGGGGYPHEASREEQIARAEQLRAIQGWGAWPACSDRLGLR